MWPARTKRKVSVVNTNMFSISEGKSPKKKKIDYNIMKTMYYFLRSESIAFDKRSLGVHQFHCDSHNGHSHGILFGYVGTAHPRCEYTITSTSKNGRMLLSESGCRAKISKNSAVLCTQSINGTLIRPPTVESLSFGRRYYSEYIFKIYIFYHLNESFACKTCKHI